MLLKSVVFQLLDRMLRLFSAQFFFKSYRHFSGLGVEIALSYRHVEQRRFFGVKRIQKSMALLVYCLTTNGRRWPTVCEFGASLGKHWFNASCLLGTTAPQFSNDLKKKDYFHGIGSVSLFIQRIGSTSAILVE